MAWATNRDFGWALSELKGGKQIARKGWNGKGQWVEMQVPTPESKMTQPYLYIRTTDGKLVPWVASQTDILSDDWVIYGA